MVNAEVTSGGESSFESQIAGRIQGFRYTPDSAIRTESATVDSAELANAVAQEFEVRANRLGEAVDSALVLANDGAIRWLGDPVAKIAAGEKLLAPRALILADEALTGDALQKAQTRVDLWLTAYVKRLLGPLFELEAAAGPEGPARNVALQLLETLGVLERGRVAQDVKALDQNARGMLRKLGVRFGAYYIYVPSLVKPATRVLATQLWALRQEGAAVRAGLDEIPQLAASGRTSFLADSTIPKETYRVAGFRLCGDRAVRVDIVERLADLIRPAVAYRPGPNAGSPPPGAADGDGFVVTGAMTSLTGCSGEQFASVLRSLGFASHRVKGPALTLVAPSAPEIPQIETGAPSSADLEAPSTEQHETVADAEAASTNVENQDAEAPAENEAQAADGLSLQQPETVTKAQQTAAERPSAEALVDEETQPAGDQAPRQPEAIAEAETEPTTVDRENAEAPRALEAQSTGDPAPDEGHVERGETVSSMPEATSVTVAASDGGTVEEPVVQAEEVLIEVWRPRPPPNRQRNPRAGARNNGSARPHEAAAGDRQDGASERTGRRRHRPSEAPAPQAAEAGSQPELQPQKPREETNRFQRGRGARRAFDASNKAEDGAERRNGPHRGRGPEERKRDERRQENAPAPIPRREPPVNLNSPFAKLLALKSQLEAKGKG